ncbi:heterogeneous nuclear ribonucleoprotein Q-like [Dorcoceras hygrometricum]|uniref:Heterogeneous nuclear ribonucleoprotein Q-like n=1 Tax=Dorcoceras hygrometricum TaxID=472368 RepID=A0A2Z7D5K7_9LAMI|nr:heterogeneous nuclear ribonucleoprotein Q-like [Dorcoceras hygrometricum]
MKPYSDKIGLCYESVESNIAETSTHPKLDKPKIQIMNFVKSSFGHPEEYKYDESQITAKHQIWQDIQNVARADVPGNIDAIYLTNVDQVQDQQATSVPAVDAALLDVQSDDADRAQVDADHAPANGELVRAYDPNRTGVIVLAEPVQNEGVNTQYVVNPFGPNLWISHGILGCRISLSVRTSRSKIQESTVL